ncbi:MAG: TorF family putative porin [Candidatus Omnitrophica bacterium]|nr:TorF family putative porin [Candidatus Omnitrophota bacterium]
MRYILKIRLLYLFCIITSAYSPDAHADDFVWVNNVTFLSEYYSRGVSQTRELPAPQITSYVYNDFGLYAGAFLSRVEFFDNDEADAEFDFYFGLNKFYKNFNYRAGLIYYTYPNADSTLNYNFLEYDLAVGYNFNPVKAEASVKISPNYFAGSGFETYSKLELKLPINQFEIQGHFARREIEDNNAFFGFPDNNDWSIGVSYKPYDKTTLHLKYVDSSFDEKRECIDLCSGRLIAGIGFDF